MPFHMPMPSPEVIEATAMLLGEPCMICSCCLGKQTVKGFFGGRRRCTQCNGWGYDYIGDKTLEAFGAVKGKWK
jgi:hypothetical protein